MSAHLRCSRCGRQPWQDLHVSLTDDGVPLCDGAECDEIALGLSTGIPKRRMSALLALSAMSALAGGGAVHRRRPRASQQYGESPEPKVPDHRDAERLAAATAKRERKAAKRRGAR